jgi:serine/threonine protein kinase
MAPERFTGGQVGPAVDVYALACLLYECLTGTPPFPRGDLTQLMASHILRAPPRPSAQRPGLTPALDDVVGRGMAKRPEARFPSAGGLARGAAAAVSAPPPRPPPPRPVVTQQLPRPLPPPQAPTQQPIRRSGFSRSQVLLASASAVLLAAAVLGFAWLAIGSDRGNSGSPKQGTTTVTTPTTSPTTSATPLSLPGTDSQGFIAYPGARCTRGDQPAALARHQSVGACRLSHNAWKPVLPRCPNQRQRRHRAHQCGARVERVRRHQSRRRHSL